MSEWTSVEWASAAAVVSAFFAAIAAGVSLLQVIRISKQREEEQQQKRIETTLQFSPFTNLEYMRSNEILMSGVSPKKSDPQITEVQLKKLEDDIALMRQYSLVFAYLNQIAIAYEQKLIDRKLAFCMFGEAINGFVGYFKPMILKYRKSKNGPALLRLCAKWEENEPS